jgi:hypothetical protein
MTLSDQFPRRFSRAVPAAAPPDATSTDSTSGPPPAATAPGSWPWRRGALVLSVAAQLITIAALVGADPIPATWSALLLAVAPAPLAALAAFVPAPAARVAAPVAVVALVVGIIAQITHTGLFFVPALAVLVVGAIKLWRERT